MNRRASPRFVNWADKRYLVIEDMEGVRQMLNKLLRTLGANSIDNAVTGGEAMGHLARTRYDVVLCDYNLGESKNGQQVLEEARQRGLLPPSAVWIMITADKSVETVMGAAELQPDAYLLKPITESSLFTRLNRAVHRRHAFREIDQTFLEKDYLRAAMMCDLQIERNKLHEVDLQRMKGKLLLLAGEWDKARAVFEQVLAERDYNWASAGLAKVYIHEHQYEQARQLLTAVIDSNRYFMEAYDQLAIACQHLGQHEQACAALDKAATLSPNSVARQQNLGALALKLGKLPLAEKAYRKCIAVGEYGASRSAEPYYGLARVVGLQGDTTEALQLLLTAQRDFADQPLDLRAKFTETQVYHAAGEAQRARQCGEELAAQLRDANERPDPATCLEMATLLFDIGLDEAAGELLDYLVRNNDDNNALAGAAQKIFDQAGMGDDGALRIQAARKEAMDVMNEGVLLWKAGKLDDAVDWTRAARAKLPNNLRILFNSAQVIITHLKQIGYDAGLAGEASAVLLHVDRILPGHPRFAQLMEELAALKAWSVPAWPDQ